MTRIGTCNPRQLSLVLSLLLACGCTAVQGERRGNAAAAIVREAPTAHEVQANPAGPPAVVGTRLHVAPGETATARALELSAKLDAAENEKQALAARVRDLQAALETKDKALKQATTEVTEARAELARARTELERWKADLIDLREKLRTADKENLATLQTTVSLLQQLLSRDDQTDSASD